MARCMRVADKGPGRKCRVSCALEKARQGGYEMKKLGLIANCTKPRAGEVVRCIDFAARRMGLKICADPSTARLLKMCKCMKIDRIISSVDAVIAIGGDGTMLRVVRELNGRDIPVIGVNIGGLGFLTSVAEGDLELALECLSDDRYVESVRSIADCSVERGNRVIGKYRALNDIVITSGATSRIMTLGVSIGRNDVTSYVSDGIIVAMPTGSTGHSLSAGGPIVTPESRVMVISVICPHTLSSRPLVIPDSSKIVVELIQCAGRVPLTVDGQVGRLLAAGDKLKISKSERGVRFIHLPGHSYFNVLRQKLRWSGSNR
ncbi:MAG: NAD(+) kinase [Verrucomicrobia bacterium]|nr:NAD(+) kinase [Verrucomicrobiota bacterium]